MFLSNQPIEFVERDGSASYQYQLPGKLPDNLVDKNSYGIITEDQRLGSGILHAPAFLLLGLGGFRIAYALTLALVWCLGFLLGEALFKNAIVAMLSGLVGALLPVTLSVNLLNPNLIGLALALLVWYLAVACQPRNSLGLLVEGLLFGVFLGVRYEGILFTPALALLLWARERSLRSCIFWCAGVLVAVLPILHWNQFAFGHPFAHPTQYEGLEGFRPTFRHRLLFWEFDFNGLLNFPLHAELVRTPHFPLPTFLTLPITLERCLGIVLSATACLGLVAQWRHHRRLFWPCLLWFFPFWALLSVMENWEELKTTFVLLVYPPVILWIACAAEVFLGKGIRKESWGVALALVIAALYGGTLLAGQLRVKADPRWYVRFPHARLGSSGLSELPEKKRNGWEFFHTDETPAEVQAEREKICSIAPWPRFLFAPSWRASDQLKSFLKEEWGRRDLRVLAIWKYIYTPPASK